MQLTSGAIQQIMNGETVLDPTLQIMGSKIIPKNQAQQSDRHRLLLSDGQHSISTAMLATQLNHLIENRQLEKFTVIKLTKYICNVIQPDKRVMILLELEVVAPGAEVGVPLGNPTLLGGKQQSSSGSSAAASAPAPAQSSKPNASAAASAGPSGPQRSFYGGNAPQSNAVRRVQQSAAPANNRNLPQTPGGSVPKVYPISSLTPYQNRWTIRVRVTQKSSVRTWSNSKGDGKLFSMNLLDESGEIRATAFTRECDKFYDMIEVNQVYYITKGTLKPANKQYSSVDNDYEMQLSGETQIELCKEEVDLPSVKFEFVPIDQLGERDANSSVDVIGVIKNALDLSTVTIKSNQREVKKRDIEMVDQSGSMIRMTIWGNDAETLDLGNNPVVAIKGARLSDYGGRSLSAVSNSQILINPDLSESHQLRGWFDSEGYCANFNSFRSDGQGSSTGGSLGNWKMLAEVLDENLGHGEKPDYFSTKSTVLFLKKENCMYMACPTDECNKKLIDQGNGSYRCEKCNKEFDNYKWRMILQINVADCTSTQWITCFQESAETVLGITANELGVLKAEDEAGFDRVFQNATFKEFSFKLRAKAETYNDEARLKVICVNAVPIKYSDYNDRLIQELETLGAL